MAVTDAQSVDAQLAWEKRTRPRAAAIAVLSGLLMIAGFVVALLAGDGRPSALLLDSLRNLEAPGPIGEATSVHVADFQFAQDNPLGAYASVLLFAFGLLGSRSDPHLPRARDPSPATADAPVRGAASGPRCLHRLSRPRDRIRRAGGLARGHSLRRPHGGRCRRATVGHGSRIGSRVVGDLRLLGRVRARRAQRDASRPSHPHDGHPRDVRGGRRRRYRNAPAAAAVVDDLSCLPHTRPLVGRIAACLGERQGGALAVERRAAPGADRRPRRAPPGQGQACRAGPCAGGGGRRRSCSPSWRHRRSANAKSATDS